MKVALTFDAEHLRELAWAAGLFEGEGCISLNHQTGRPGRYVARMAVAMTDEDSVRRFHRAVCVGRTSKPRPMPSGKVLWTWGTNRFEDVQHVICLLWYGLGGRRRAKAAEVLRGVTYWKPRTHCPHGHAYTDENTYVDKRNKRMCRACGRAKDRRRRLTRAGRIHI